MPCIPDDALKSVVFLCVDENSADGKTEKLFGGTGFFVRVQEPSVLGPPWDHVYLVTAKHNIVKAGKGPIYVRFNTKDGGAEYARVVGAWEYPEDPASDLAVVSLTGLNGPLGQLDGTAFPIEGLLTREKALEHGIGPGEDLAIVGLFSSRVGSLRNLPIVRSGIIACMPLEPISDDSLTSGLSYHAYLAEVRSLSGLSGSPVYGYHETPEWLAGDREAPHRRCYLLGVVRGHFELKQGTAPPFRYGKETGAVHQGLTAVTPADELLGVLNCPKFKEERQRFVSKLLKQIQDGGNY